MIKVAIKKLGVVKFKFRPGPKKKVRSGKRPVYVVIPHEDDMRGVDSIWIHPMPELPDEIAELLIKSGYGSLGMMRTLLASSGFYPEGEDIGRVRLYSNDDMNKAIIGAKR